VYAQSPQIIFTKEVWIMPHVDSAALAKAEEEFSFAESAYRQKLANLVALAKAVLAAKPEDAGVNTKGQGDPLKGHS
jgi:hypothetical protein